MAELVILLLTVFGAIQFRRVSVKYEKNSFKWSLFGALVSFVVSFVIGIIFNVIASQIDQVRNPYILFILYVIVIIIAIGVIILILITISKKLIKP